MLEVSAPFHCSLMAYASGVMAEALAVAKIAAPCVPVVANVTAQAETDADIIRRLLVDQVTSVVRWRESIEYIKSKQVQCLIEVGAGKVLSGLNKRIAQELQSFNIGNPAELAGFAQVE